MFRSFMMGFLRLLAILFVASFAGACLLRAAPGFSADERELNSNLSSQSIEAIRSEHLADANIPRFYARYIDALLRGDLGKSISLNQPVRELLRERLPVTLRALALSLTLAWLLGLGLASIAQVFRSKVLRVAGESLSSGFISTPAVALALVFVLLRLPSFWAAALLVFPKIYRYATNLLQHGYNSPHVLLAHAKGAGRLRIFLWHVTPVALPQLIALLGVSLSIAIGVLLPIEVVSDSPGIGQLAWQAAQSRDLPLLVNLTIVVTFVTVVSTSLSGSARKGLLRSAV